MTTQQEKQKAIDAWHRVVTKAIQAKVSVLDIGVVEHFLNALPVERGDAPEVVTVKELQDILKLSGSDTQHDDLLVLATDFPNGVKIVEGE